ncbi:hypothetical protein FRB94_007666 [Tulasnella sp. JGI-2019a]|nr:hypothetical protein FRB93_006904 [Tulasnella sp. JGI-2019a]KAG8997419.1 hypothetical protein FRB94_007666 [Tulasnella sp. JGI-2019a]
MLDRINKLEKVLTAVSKDLQHLEREIRSTDRAIATVQEVQGRINECVSELTHLMKASPIGSLDQVDIDRLRYYLELKKDGQAIAEMSALRLLDQHLRPVSARYNSSARGGVSGCLEGTRVAILQNLRDWILSPDQRQFQIVWLKGQAGTGKSTIAHTISEDCAAIGNLGASFFFSRDQADRADGLRVFTTIAYQLACSIPGFRASLVTALKDNLDATSSDLLTQLTKLIVEPLYGDTRDAPPPIVIVLDALNECENSHATNIIKHLASIAFKLPYGCRIRVLVTSRPEPNMEDAISTISSDIAKPLSIGQVRESSSVNLKSAKSASRMKLEVANLDEVEPVIVKADIGLYLKDCLQSKKRIATDAEVERLLEIIQGLFIVASTAVRFIEDSFTPDTEGWKNQLEILLSTDVNSRQVLRTVGAQGSSAGTSHTESFGALDLMYSEVLQSALLHWRKKEKRLEKDSAEVIGAIALLFNPLPPQSLEALLQLAPCTVTSVMLPLRPVAFISNPDKADSAPLRLIHSSFPEFLTTPSRCTDSRFFVSPTPQHSRIALHCLDHMYESLTRDMCGIGSLPTLNSTVTDLHRRLQINIPLHLQYACSYWPLHLARAGLAESANKGVQKAVVLQLADVFEKFVHTKMLCWLEIMSLLGRLDTVVPLLRVVESGLQSINGLSETLEIVRDSQRFVTRFFKPIRDSAGGIYASALPFTPQCHLYNQYQSQLSQPNASAVVRLGRERNWSDAATQSHAAVTSVAFSPNGAYIAAAFSDERIELWAHVGLALATLVEPTSPSRLKANPPDSNRSSDHKTAQAYGEKERSGAGRGDGVSTAVGSVSFAQDSRQVMFRSSTGHTWAHDITRYPVAIVPRDVSTARGHLQWEYPWVTYLDWRLCSLGEPNWTWASRGHQMTLGTPLGQVLLLDFSSVIRVVDKYRSQGIAPNHPLPFRHDP